MKKNKIIIILIIFIGLVSICLTFNKKEEYKELPKVKLKEQNSKKQFALMVEQTSGKGDYEESNDELPTIGYVFNKEKSSCTDINGKVIKDILDYDYENYIVLLDTSKTSYCYLYYDKLTLGETIRKINSKGLNNEMEGGLYRYQGVKGEVDNYVCLNEKCDSNNRYRIIGINEDNEVKLIKEESLGTISYGNSNFIDTEWPESNAYKALNINENSFYNSLSKDIKDMIIEKDYYYAKMNYASFSGASNYISPIYRIESGIQNMLYSQNVSVSEEGQEKVNCKTITNDKGIVNEKKCYKYIEEPTKSFKSNIGLMYAHDYYYCVQKTGINCFITSENSDVCSNSWLFNNFIDLLITIRGYAEDAGVYDVWYITKNGLINSGDIVNFYNYRPVFYIKNDLRVVDGKGTIEEPFIIKK